MNPIVGIENVKYNEHLIEYNTWGYTHDFQNTVWR